MVAYLNRFLAGLPQDASVKRWQTELRRRADTNRTDGLPETQGFPNTYSRMLDDTKDLAFPDAFQKADMPVIAKAMANPGNIAVLEMGVWWQARAQSIADDLLSINPKTKNTYLEDIFNQFNVKLEDPSQFQPLVAKLVINYYLRYTLLPQVIKKIKANDPTGVMAVLAPDQLSAPELWADTIANLLAEQTAFISETVVDRIDKNKIIVRLNNELNDGFAGDPNISAELVLLVDWCYNLDPKIAKNPKLLSATIGDYLFSEDENGKFLIHLLMRDLLGIKEGSSEYNRNQQAFFLTLFKKIFQKVNPSVREPQLSTLFNAELTRQASITDQEQAELKTHVEEFNLHLRVIKTPEELADTTRANAGKDDIIRAIFNESADDAIKRLYGEDKRRVSLAEKLTLKDTLVEHATVAADSVRDQGLVISTPLLDLLKSFTTGLMEWASSIFFPKTEVISKDTSSMGSNPSIAASHLVLSGAKRLEENLEQKFAPSPTGKKSPPALPK